MFFVTHKDSLWLVAVATGAKKNTMSLPQSKVSHKKSVFLLMLITKYCKPTHVA